MGYVFKIIGQYTQYTGNFIYLFIFKDLCVLFFMYFWNFSRYKLCSLKVEGPLFIAWINLSCLVFGSD